MIGKTSIVRHFYVSPGDRSLAPVKICVDTRLRQFIIPGDCFAKIVQERRIERVWADPVRQRSKPLLNCSRQSFKRIPGNYMSRQLSIRSGYQLPPKLSSRFVKDHDLVKIWVVPHPQVVYLVGASALGVDERLIIHAHSVLVDDDHT